MTNLGFTGKEITKKLDSKTIFKGGLEIVTMPIAKVSNELETIEFGGYPSLVHYNKDREIQHSKDKANKRRRSLNRQIKRKSCCNTGNEFPAIHLNKEGDINS